MKELFCHKFMTEQELEPYRLQEKQCTIAKKGLFGWKVREPQDPEAIQE